MRLYFSTPVWGAGHIELFKTIGLPSLLSPSNLPALSKPAECRYFIYTRAQDVALLRDCDAFRRLEALMPVEIRPLPEMTASPYRTLSECNADTLRRADEDDVAAVFVPPDCIWSDGSFANLEKLADAGKSVVQITGVRLDKDAATPALLERVTEQGAVLAMQPRDLVALGLRHLHPIALSHFFGEYEGKMHPANLYWSAPGQGLVARCFHLHPLLVKSQVKFAKFAGTIDDDLTLSACPDLASEHVVADSDEILTFELSPPGHEVGAPYSKRSIESVAAWTEVTNRRHRQLAERTIRLHYEPIDDRIWRPIEAEAERVMSRARRINARSAPLLAVTNPRVFAWRVVATLTGRGLFADRRSNRWNAARQKLFAKLPRLRAVAHRLLRWSAP